MLQLNTPFMQLVEVTCHMHAQCQQVHQNHPQGCSTYPWHHPYASIHQSHRPGWLLHHLQGWYVHHTRLGHKLVGRFLKRKGYTRSTACALRVHLSAQQIPQLAIIDAHCHLSHISPDTIRHLCRDDSSWGSPLARHRDATCNSCAYMKMMHNPLPKEGSGKCADSPRKEVHTDMWGCPQSSRLVGSYTHQLHRWQDPLYMGVLTGAQEQCSTHLPFIRGLDENTAWLSDKMPAFNQAGNT